MSNLSHYPPSLHPLLAGPRLNPLGPGTPNPAAKPLLDKLTPNDLANGAPLADSAMARACLAGLWLYHNYLDESHNISQGIETPTGSLWHAIMHRREPDAGNAAYWLRRVGNHPIFEPLAEQAGRIAADLKTEDLLSQLIKVNRWDPFAFTDLCDKSRDKNDPAENFCVRVQLAEWQLLFEYCIKKSTTHS